VIRSADIVVCTGDDAALGGADAVRGAAVLLVVQVDDTTPPTPARQQELARRHGRVVVLPHLPEWAGLSGVPDEAEALFARPPEQLSPALSAYTRGLRIAVAALLRTGVLTRPRPSTLTWSPPTTGSTPKCGYPAPTGLSPTGPSPYGRGPTTAAPMDPTTARPAPADPVPDPTRALATLALDDDAIEAEVLAATAHESAPPAATAHGSEPAAASQAAVAAATAPRPSTAAALTPGRTATPLRIRALHRPVIGAVRVESAKAG
jgi:hypothetical protein